MPSAAGVLAALAVGDQAAIDRDDWDLFRDTGVAHLMSISGLHVTMFAWLAAGLIGRLWRRSPRAMLALPAPTAALLGRRAGRRGYALLAGWGVPAQRTLWMLAALALLRSAGLRWPCAAGAAGGGGVVTLLDPWALLQPGFWLSFVAVGLLMVVPEPVSGAPPRGRLARAASAGPACRLRTQAVATLGLAPLSLVFFQQVSLVGFVANLVAIPLVTLVITPLALLGVAGSAAVGAGSAAGAGLVGRARRGPRLPLGGLDGPAAPAGRMARGLAGRRAAGAAVALAIAARSALPLVLPLLCAAAQRPADGEFELVAPTSGRARRCWCAPGSTCCSTTPGPRTRATATPAQRVLLPLLRARGECGIDLLMLSHRDIDHVGGARVAAGGAAGGPCCQFAEPRSSAAGARRAATRRCDAGQAWEWDGVRFEVLHPWPATTTRHGPPNALSCVLRVQGAGAQRAAHRRHRGGAGGRPGAARRRGLRSHVLLVPHHGSRTSSSDAFIGAVRRTWRWCRPAYRSRFGHPAPEVLAR